MSHTLRDRHEEMFGRHSDIQKLREHVLAKGITFVTGRPKMGKTWLLEELGRQLAYEETQWVADRPKFLVGYHECVGEDDQLLRAVVDLYTRWLEQADHAQQATALFAGRSSSGTVETTGRVLVELFHKTASVLPAGETLGSLVKGAFERLVSLNSDLKTGGLILQKLPVDITRDLITHLCALSGQRAVLILDGWDQSSTINHERKILEHFLNRIDDWPDCRIYVGVRHPEIDETQNNTPAFDAALRLCDASGDAILYELAPLSFPDARAPEAQRLLHSLRALLPNAAEIKDATLLHTLDGYPGTLNRWRQSKGKLSRAVKILPEMKRLAHDAQAYRYPEFKNYIPALRDHERILALRLALLPRLNEPLWNALKAIINDGVHEDTWTKLVTARVLEAEPVFPTYGHDTRHQAARLWFLNQPHLGAQVRQQAQILVLMLAGRIQNAEPETLPFSVALAALRPVLSPLRLEPAVELVLAAVRSLFGAPVPAPGLRNANAIVRTQPSIAALVAMALFNTINDAKAENDLHRRDALLGELRALYRASPADAPIRAQLAKALVNTCNDAKDENDLPRRNALLKELSALHHAFPADALIREQLATALFNTAIDAKEENDLPKRDALLDELRALHQGFPADAPIREQLAKALLNIGNDAKAENNRVRRDALVDELRALHQAFPADSSVRERLAKALFNAGNDARAENNRPLRDDLLNDLRALHQAFPADARIPEQLAKALVNTGNAAKAENHLSERDALLDELRALHRALPADAAVREPLATALLNTAIDAKDENNLHSRDALLAELRALHQAFPDDDAVLKAFLTSLALVLRQLLSEEQKQRSEALLEELNGLIESHAERPAVKTFVQRVKKTDGPEGPTT